MLSAEADVSVEPGRSHQATQLEQRGVWGVMGGIGEKRGTGGRAVMVSWLASLQGVLGKCVLFHLSVLANTGT